MSLAFIVVEPACVLFGLFLIIIILNTVGLTAGDSSFVQMCYMFVISCPKILFPIFNINSSARIAEIADTRCYQQNWHLSKR